MADTFGTLAAANTDMHLVAWEEDISDPDYYGRGGFPVHTRYCAAVVEAKYADGGEGQDDFTRCPRDYAEMVGDSTRSYQLAIAEALTNAYVVGVRTVVMPDGHTRRLRSSEGRQELVVANQAEQARIEAYCAKIRDIRCAAERITERIAGTPTADDIVEFFGQWKALTGYGPRTGKAEDLPILAGSKQKIIARLLAMAVQRGWQVGTQMDYSTHSRYKQVVYIDTPQGQASFHTLPGEYAHLPAYQGKWSGLHDTPDIVAAILGSQTQAQLAHA